MLKNVRPQTTTSIKLLYKKHITGSKKGSIFGYPLPFCGSIEKPKRGLKRKLKSVVHTKTHSPDVNKEVAYDVKIVHTAMDGQINKTILPA